MYLNTDYVTPQALTGYARAALADLDVNTFRLSAYLPAVAVDDLDYRFNRGGEGLIDAATFRAYDAESPIGSRPGTARVSGELPPISRKIRLGEYDRLRQRGTAPVADGIMSDAERMVRSVQARIELARGEALYSGKVTVNENGVKATVDFGRTAGHSVVASTLWSNTASATPLSDLRAWFQTYVNTNGQAPGVILTSTQVLGYLTLNAEFRNLMSQGSVGSPSVVTPAQVNTVLSAWGLPNIVTYDAQVRVNGSAQRVIPADRVVFLPADAGDLGATLYGTTAESLEADFGLAGAEAGIVAGAYSTKDPVAVWTKAAAIALPVVANPDLTFAADVA